MGVLAGELGAGTGEKAGVGAYGRDSPGQSSKARQGKVVVGVGGVGVGVRGFLIIREMQLTRARLSQAFPMGGDI